MAIAIACGVVVYLVLRAQRDAEQIHVGEPHDLHSSGVWSSKSGLVQPAAVEPTNEPAHILELPPGLNSSKSVILEPERPRQSPR